MPPPKISFRFEENGRFHDDLVLRLGDMEWRCDSYYLLIDDETHLGREDANKVRAVLRTLIEQRGLAVSALRDGDVCYLGRNSSTAVLAVLS